MNDDDDAIIISVNILPFCVCLWTGQLKKLSTNFDETFCRDGMCE